MSYTTDVFVGTEASNDEIVAVLESGLGVGHQLSTDEHKPYFRVGEAAVHVVGDHDFFEFYEPDDNVIPLETEYPYWIEVRDVGDIDRQRSAGQHVFEILKQAGRWRVLYIDNFELVADSYDPAVSSGS